MAVPYKRTSRSVREIASDNTYASGMKYTNRPIPAGYNRRLINFVHSDNGVALTTRAPLIFEKQSNGILFSDKDILDTVTEGMLTAKNGSVPADESTTAVIYHQESGESGEFPVYDEGFSSGNAELNATMKKEDSCRISIASFRKNGDLDYISGGNIYVPLYTPPGDKFNNLKFSTLKYMRKPLCTPGFNGKFFALGFDDKTISGKPPGVTPRVLFGDTSWLGQDPYNPPAPAIGILRKPKELYASQMANMMYNMLANNPYRAANAEVGSVLTLTGLLTYDYDTNNIVVNPRVNQWIKIRAYYNYSGDVYTDYEFKFEWRNAGADEWTKIKQVKSSPDGNVRVSFVNPDERIQIRVTVIRITGDKPVDESTMEMSYVSMRNDRPDTPDNYVLHNARHLAYWFRRIVVYGVKDAANAIFLSEINDPTWFPYPSNFEQFDHPVLKVVPYLNDLLVFTEREIWRITLNSDGLTWIKTLVQGGLSISEDDAQYITCIKRFVLFKQNNYFYMVVPSGASAGALAVSNVSEPIAELLDDLNGFVDETLHDMFDYYGARELHKVFTYVTSNDVHIALSFYISEFKEYLTIDLVYSTALRSWTVQTYATPSLFVPHFEDSQRYCRLYTLCDVRSSRLLTTLGFDEDSLFTADTYGQHFPNRQLLDTGYRQLMTQLKKRFREVQYRVRFYAPAALQFSTEYWVDNVRVKPPGATYTLAQTINPNDPSEVFLHVTQQFGFDNPASAYNDPIIPNKARMAGDNKDSGYLPYWRYEAPLNTPQLHWRIRHYGHDKGEAPRMIIRSRNDCKFDLLENLWVFRVMNAR